MSTIEINFDGIVGPTHNYSGLSYGNVASERHQGETASPKEAALQGLAKMRFVAEAGFGQAVLPPLPRPRIGFLRSLGFSGTPHEVIEAAFRTDPVMLAVAFSASNMWTANAATVSPSADTQDGRVHITPANLSTLLHRSIECDQTHALIRQIFCEKRHFQVHSPLPSSQALSDEGAANHTRLCLQPGSAGVEFFVWGRSAMSKGHVTSVRYPARQTLESCEALVRRHQLNANRVVMAQQNPTAIDHGVFHNDVISVGSGNLLLAHERSFVDQAHVLDDLQSRYAQLGQGPLICEVVSDEELPLPVAVQSYLFNSQLLQTDSGNFQLICPVECQHHPQSLKVLTRWEQDPKIPIERVSFLDLRQSMNNGGGPACLRLRVVLNPVERDAVWPKVMWSMELDQQLVAWVQRNYRDQMAPADLRDPALLNESAQAGMELSKILNLPPSLLVDPELM